MDLIADTTFLVGLWRRQSWATSFANANSLKSIGLPWVVLGEFWHGSRRAGHDSAVVREFLALGLPILDPEPIIPVYADLCAGQTPGHPEQTPFRTNQGVATRSPPRFATAFWFVNAWIVVDRSATGSVCGSADFRAACIFFQKACAGWAGFFSRRNAGSMSLKNHEQRMERTSRRRERRAA